MKARWIVALSILIGISFSFAKTRMIVEDPNSPVVGRYAITIVYVGGGNLGTKSGYYK
jgi:hypothetical protein